MASSTTSRVSQHVSSPSLSNTNILVRSAKRLIDNPEYAIVAAVLSYSAYYVAAKSSEERGDMPSARRLSKEDEGEEGEQSRPRIASKSSEVKVRGKTFNQTAESDDVDLGWRGAAPFYAAPVLIGFETYLLARYGVKSFKYRGYTPAQRAIVMTYSFFAVLPLLDNLIGQDWSNPTNEAVNKRRQAWRFKLPLYLWTVVEFVLTYTTFKIVFGPEGKRLGLRNRLAMLSMSMLVNGALGITVSHELIHKHSALDRALGHALLVNVNYTWWGQEHLDAHHDVVATPEDPATSRKGETLYAFIPRCALGTWRAACELEATRLRSEEGITSWYTPKNQILQGIGLSVAWAAFLAKSTGSLYAIPTFFAMGAVSASLLEVVNYMEHYGLMRNQLPDGSYEPVDPRHSWNAANMLSNTVLFKLARHSDHHTFASRPYEILRNFAESPQLPAGYAGIYVLALFPPVYFNIMDDLLQAHKLEYLERGSSSLSEEDARRIVALKSRARVKMFAWTWSLFLGGTFLLGYRLRAMKRKA